MQALVKHAVIALGTAGAAALLVLACGSTKDSTFDTDDGGGSSGQFDTDGSFGDLKPDGGDLYASDPPPKWCGPAGQPEPPKPGGTIDCPDDKNKPGCACDTLGATAPCWTGLRANRKLGVCKDGVATCVQINETRKGWSECVGEVLPQPNANKGGAACKCFSQGQWKLANLSPCFLEICGALEQDPLFPNDATRKRCVSTTVTYRSATSSVLNGATIQCPQAQNPQPQPAGTWTANTLNVDCAGEFELCYELKAGDFANPQATDCSLSKVCTKGVYAKENVEQAFPELGTWTTGGGVGSAQDTCIQKWNAGGGYGEMTVKGLSVRCDDISDNGKPYVFNRVKYCPPKCRGGASSDPECKDCQSGGSGTF
jgi:hypothetical protein